MLAIAKSSKSYELLDNNEVIGRLTYKGLFNASADIHTLNEGDYSIKWFFSLIAKKFKITQNDEETIKLKMNWRGHFSIIMKNGSEYKFISKGIFKNRIYIENQENKEVISVSSKYNWKRWNYDYEMENSETPQKDLLSLVTVYALNYQQQYQMGIMLMCIFSSKFIADFLIK